MFDTSIVRGHTATAERGVGLFTVSLAVHSAIIVAAIGISLRTIEFPRRAPNQSEILQVRTPVMIPPALGTSRPAAARPPLPATRPVATAPATPVAPPIVPDTIPTVPVSPSTDVQNRTNPEGGGAGGGRGSGSVGTEGGSNVGVGEGPLLTAAPDAAGPLVISGEVKAPVVVHRVQPEFPEIARRVHKGGVVRVLCIIDKTGAVVKARVVSSTFAAFDQPALDAVQQWRFVPGSLRGHSVDTFFELTVTFSLR